MRLTEPEQWMSYRRRHVVASPPAAPARMVTSGRPRVLGAPRQRSSSRAPFGSPGLIPDTRRRMSFHHLRQRKRLPAVVAVTAVFVTVLTGSVLGNPLEQPALLRVAQSVPASARTVARPLVLTLGGPVYCAQARPIAGYLDAT